MLRNASSKLFSGVRHVLCTTRSVCTSSRPAVAINGFGRIGKCLLRQSIQKEMNVVAVNQPCSNMKEIVNSLRYDTVHGFFDRRVDIHDKYICIGGQHVNVYHEENPEKLKWKDASVDYVIDSSGKFTENCNAMKHIKAGAKKVIVSAPSKDIPMVIKGVNFDCYNKSMKTVSASSCTTVCAAPVLKALHKKFNVVNCLLTTTHAITPVQHVHDGLGYRSATDNIKSASTDAVTALGTVLPDLKGKLEGDASRVPVLDVCLLKLFINFKEKVTADAIKQEIMCQAEGELKDVLFYVSDKLVSSDFIGCQYAGVVDFNQIQINDKLVSIGVWYDNEMGYSSMLLDLVNHMVEVDKKK